MTDRIFIWVGHPRAGSFCEALADRYQAGAEKAGAEVQRLDLSAMAFDIGAFDGYGHDAPDLEPALAAWQQAVLDADHLLFIHPYWWGAMPAKAKAVLDRALLPGFAYKYRGRGISWDKLLTGRTADVIVTSDTPPLLDTLLYGKPGRKVMKNQVLDFCGVKVRRTRQFGTIKTASDKQRATWLETAEKMGASAVRRRAGSLFGGFGWPGAERGKQRRTAFQVEA